MTRRLELLAPGGDLDSIKAAIVAGADAIYCGLGKFNARHRAKNITLDDLGGILALAHSHDVQVFLTLNIMMVESDIPIVVGILNKLVNTSLDGVIVQDLGLFYLLSKFFEGLRPHASTQLTTHNAGQIGFLSRLGASRVNLSRELSIDEIRPLVAAGRKEQISTEVFVHGSLCLSFSGLCYMSSVHGGNSGNRGRCSQPCRDQFLPTPQGKEFPLNLKDNSAYFDLPRLADAGVDALKIEGRMKPFHYVHTVTKAFRRRLDSLARGEGPIDESGDLHKVFNRGFSNAFLMGERGQHLFSDHPRNRSATHLRLGDVEGREDDPEGAKEAAYELIANFKEEVKSKIDHVCIASAPLTVRVSGKAGTPLEVSVHTPETSFVVSSASCLAPRHGSRSLPQLDAELFEERLKALDETEFFIEHLDVGGLEPGLFLPIREIKAIRKRILFVLNGSKESIESVDVPMVARRRDAPEVPTLSVLVASARDLHLCHSCEETGAQILFQLPSAVKREYRALQALFARHERLIPAFPTILIGEDYAAAVELLRRMSPRKIVTNNTGIAYEACKEGIPWIAGPYLNTANSFGLLALKENFQCRGAYLSNELSVYQLKRVSPPEGFELYYSIYHPIVLLTSRQCLFQQVTGCAKTMMDDACLAECEKASTITSLDGASSFVEKTKGNHSSIYHRAHFLNTEIVAEISRLFTGFLIDLRDIETETRVTLDKASLVRLFEEHLRGDEGSGEKLDACIRPSTDAQYRLGV